MPGSALPPQYYESTLLLAVTGWASQVLSAAAHRARTAVGGALRRVLGGGRDASAAAGGEGVAGPSNLPVSPLSTPAPRRLSLTGVTMAQPGVAETPAHASALAQERQHLVLQRNFLRPLADVRTLSALIGLVAAWAAARLYGGLSTFMSACVALAVAALCARQWQR